MSALVITKSLAIRATSPFRLRVIGAWQQSIMPGNGIQVGRRADFGARSQVTRAIRQATGGRKQRIEEERIEDGG